MTAASRVDGDGGAAANSAASSEATRLARSYLEQELAGEENVLLLGDATREEVLRRLNEARERRSGGGMSGAPPPSARSAKAVPSRAASYRATGKDVAGARGKDVAGATGKDIAAATDEDIAAAQDLEALAALVRGCTRCMLHRNRKNPVFGEGAPEARLVCVGEAPGAREDETGRPFVGRAGRLLDRLLASVGLQRSSVYICNVLKSRPPGNRDPLPGEVAACSPYLARQLSIIQPEIVVAFGAFAARFLLGGIKSPLGRLRGRVHRYDGHPVIVTYHPAALLRNPSWTRLVWEDLQMARRMLAENEAAADADG